MDFANSFWSSNQAWTVVDLSSGVSGNGGSGVFTLGAVSGGSHYSPTLGTFTVTRVADGNGKNDVVLNWTVSSTSTPYQTWIDSYTSIPVFDRDMSDDPDRDGATNLAEFAFKGVPNISSSRGLFFTATKDNGDPDSAKELTFTCAVRRSASVNFAADGNNAQTAVIDGVTYTIEGSATLTGTWNSPVSHIGKSDSPPAGSSLPLLTGTDWEYHTFSAFNGLPGKGFLRAKVTSSSSGSTSSPYETWINGYSTSIPSATDREPGADPDHDGATNLAEFAFKGVPNNSSDRGLFFTVTKDNGDGDSAKELTFTCAVRRSTTVNFAANGNNAQTAVIDGVTYTIEGSATLTGTWNSPVSHIGKSNTPPAGSSLPALTGTDWEYHTFSAFNGLPGKGFLRAKVTQP